MRSIFLSVLLAVCFAAPSYPASAVKVGTVDMQRLMTDCPTAAKLRDKFRDMATENQRGMDQQDREINKLIMDYSKRKASLSEGDAQKQEKLIRKKQEERAQALDIANSKVQAMARQAEQALREELKGVIAQVAQAQGLDLVLDSGTILYAANAVDLTDLVLRRVGGKPKK